MMIRTTNSEMVDVIKDMTRELPDCGHHWPDPDNCYICYGKQLTKADEEGNLIILNNQLNRKGYESINKRLRKKSRTESNKKTPVG